MTSILQAAEFAGSLKWYLELEFGARPRRSRSMRFLAIAVIAMQGNDIH